MRLFYFRSFWSWADIFFVVFGILDLCSNHSAYESRMLNVRPLNTAFGLFSAMFVVQQESALSKSFGAQYAANNFGHKGIHTDSKQKPWISKYLPSRMKQWQVLNKDETKDYPLFPLVHIFQSQMAAQYFEAGGDKVLVSNFMLAAPCQRRVL